MVRYADNFVILCRSQAEAEEALSVVQQWTSENGLTLHPEKTCIVNANSDGFEFLGYHVHGEHRWPRKKSLKKLKDTLRAKTKRTHGRSPSSCLSILSEVTPPTGEPDAEEPHVRFGGRGDRNQSVFPTPIT